MTPIKSATQEVNVNLLDQNGNVLYPVNVTLWPTDQEGQFFLQSAELAEFTRVSARGFKLPDGPKTFTFQDLRICGAKHVGKPQGYTHFEFKYL